MSFTYAEVEYKEVFDQEIRDDAVITVENYNFSITVMPDYNKTKVIFPSGYSTLLSYDQCAFEDGYNVCYTAIRQAPDEEFNMTTQKYPFYANIKIERPHTDITITRNFEKTTIYQGEKVKVDTTILNEGSKNIENAVYTANFTDDIEILNPVNSQKEKNKIIWKGKLDIDEKETLSYYIKGLNPSKFRSDASLKYENNEEEKHTDLKVLAPQLVIRSDIPKNMDLEEEAEFDIFLYNNDSDEDITLSYKIFLPEEVTRPDTVHGFTKTLDYHLHTDSLEAKENKTIKMTIVPKKVGNFEIIEKAEYETDSFSNEVQYSHDIQISSNKLIIGIEKEEEYKPGQNNIGIKIINPGPNSYKDLNLKLTLPLEEKSFTINKIKPHETVNVTKISFNIPEEESKLKASLKYNTLYDQVIENNKEVLLYQQSNQENNIDEQDALNASTDQDNITKDELSDNYLLYIIIAVVAFIMMLVIIVGVIRMKHDKTLEDKIDKIE
jgi:hypothetical protein